jgi:hypothetical protein
MPVGEVTNAETPELYMSSASAAALRIAIAVFFALCTQNFRVVT